MTDRVAHDRAGTGFAGRKQFLPHLVCRWTLDSASHRLSCAWAPPTDRSHVTFSSAGIATSGLRPGFALAASQA
jgi:hypothetical protein